jgi:hypothetical protein
VLPSKEDSNIWPKILKHIKLQVISNVTLPGRHRSRKPYKRNLSEVAISIVHYNLNHQHWQRLKSSQSAVGTVNSNIFCDLRLQYRHKRCSSPILTLYRGFLLLVLLILKLLLLVLVPKLALLEK